MKARIINSSFIVALESILGCTCGEKNYVPYMIRKVLLTRVFLSTRLALMRGFTYINYLRKGRDNDMEKVHNH